jgi:hypothetical protein
MQIDTQTIVLMITATISAASTFCALTPTPAPGSVWATVYSVIEGLALLVGKAKDTGLAPPTAAERGSPPK